MIAKMYFIYTFFCNNLDFSAKLLTSVCFIPYVGVCKPPLNDDCSGQKLSPASITFSAAGFSLCLRACLLSISACVSEGEAVSNRSSLQAHSTTPGGITQRSAHSGCDTGSTDNPPGSRLTLSNESTQQSLSTRPGPKEMYVLTMSGMTTPLLD